MTTAEKNADNARAVPETELASVVLHAGEMSDITYLKDYIQVRVRKKERPCSDTHWISGKIAITAKMNDKKMMFNS